MPSSIKINVDIWSPLSAEEKDKITGILKNTNLLSQDGSIESASDATVGSDEDDSDVTVVDAQAVIADPQGWIDKITKKLNVCKTACDVAAAAAASACTASTSGVGLAACLAAAEAARRACRDAC